MIRLEIDNEVVALPPESTFEFYDYNTIFDTARNRGAYTCDIDININDGNNARLYGHINRINGSNVFTGRSARLYVDGKKVLEGKEILLECNGPVVKIQLVCGNSEVNYASGETRIAELDLGSLPEYTYESALETINAEPLSVDAVCTPVLVDYKGNPFVTQNVERETISKMINLASYTDLWSEQGSYHSETRLIGQPYLVVVIERVLEAMGWTVSYDVLREMEYSKRLIVIHGYETREIAKMIPNWKVSDFLEQVQRMFNVIILHSEEHRTVEIHNRDIFYERMTRDVYIDIEDVICDEASPSRKYDGTDEYVYGYDAVKYDLPSEKYGYRGDLSDDVKRIVPVQDFETKSDFNGPDSEYRAEDFYNKPTILRDLSNDTKWILTKGLSAGKTKYVFERVDQFAHCRKANFVDGESTETVLKIVPAETLVMSILILNPTVVACGVVVPYTTQVGVVDADMTTSKDYGLNQWIEGNAPKAKDTTSEKLYVAQFLGRASVLSDSWNPSSSTYERYASAKYPQVFTHRWIGGRLYTNASGAWDTVWRDYIMDALWDKPEMEDNITFSLEKRLENLYTSHINVNDKEAHTISFRTNRRHDVRAVFNIAGRRFICVNMRYQVQGGKLSRKVTGTFLPLKL